MIELSAVTKWFIEKNPDDKAWVEWSARIIELPVCSDLERRKARNLIAFAIFSYAMHHGPFTFQDIEGIMSKYHLESEMTYWATNWLDYAKTTNDGKQSII